MGLFSLSSNKLAIQPNPYSFIVPNHLTIFKFIGNLIGRVYFNYIYYYENNNIDYA